MQHTDVSNTGHYHDDEIDLFELAAQLWDGRWLIVLTTAVAFALALVYLQFAQPVYESEATLLPPTGSSIATLNVGRAGRIVDVSAVRLERIAPLKPVEASDIYRIFLRHLNSGTNKRLFFEEVYATRERLEVENLEEPDYEREYQRFLNHLSIVAPGRNQTPDYYQVVFTYSDPELAASWVESYIELAADKALAEIMANIGAELMAREYTLNLQKSTLVERAQQDQQDTIAQLEEAFAIAEAIGIKEPLVLMGREQNTERGVAFQERNMLYLRGSRALSAELKALKARKNIEPFIEGLREIESELAYLNQVRPDAEGVFVYTLDEAATVPQSPIKPRKLIILLISIMAGGILGVFSVLLLNGIKSYQSRVSA